MRLSNKLFLSFLGLTTVILIATLSLARWSFERGFLDFINGQETQRLQYVADELIT
jgi:two-component system, OmpR family, sensor histidine kinase BaeS